MTEGEAAAVTVAIIALVVSCAAAGFTGWQAISEHIGRTTPRKASFTIAMPKYPHERWSLVNTGGSLATDVVVSVTYLVKPQTRVFKAVGLVEPGGFTGLEGTQNQYLPNAWYVPNPEKPGTYTRVETEEKGAKRVIARDIAVTWRDYRGNPRKGTIRAY